eukprot:3111458-Rhodomonas_salina.1
MLGSTPSLPGRTMIRLVTAPKSACQHVISTGTHVIGTTPCECWSRAACEWSRAYTLVGRKPVCRGHSFLFDFTEWGSRHSAKLHSRTGRVGANWTQREDFVVLDAHPDAENPIPGTSRRFPPRSPCTPARKASTISKKGS